MGKEAGKKNMAGPIIFMFGFAFNFAVVLLAYAGTPEDASQLRQVCQASLLLSKNIWLPVIFHTAHNLSTILLPASSGIYVLLNPNAKYGVMGTAAVIIAAALIMFCIGVKLLCEAIREHRISVCTTPHFDDII